MARYVTSDGTTSLYISIYRVVHGWHREDLLWHSMHSRYQDNCMACNARDAHDACNVCNAYVVIREVRGQAVATKADLIQSKRMVKQLRAAMNHNGDSETTAIQVQAALIKVHGMCMVGTSASSPHQGYHAMHTDMHMHRQCHGLLPCITWMPLHHLHHLHVLVHGMYGVAWYHIDTSALNLIGST